MKTNIRELVKQAHETGDYSQLIAQIPYANKIGVSCERFGDDVIFKLPANKLNIGNPLLPAIHGGVIGGFMELSAALYLMMFQDVPKLPKIVDFSIDYLRAGYYQDTFVECELTRQGKRVANVSIYAWQKTRNEPITTARAHFLIPEN